MKADRKIKNPTRLKIETTGEMIGALERPTDEHFYRNMQTLLYLRSDFRINEDL